jgi:2-C-methyl-D-erythritol 4-phosphate cytidylyltransferase
MAVRAGYRVRLVPGDPANLKATRRDDLPVLEALLAGS